MKKLLKILFASLMAILILQAESFGQGKLDVAYGQISASMVSYGKDLRVEHFIFGSEYSSDTLLANCKMKVGLTRRADLNVTDALNYLKSQGWELVTVYLVHANDVNYNRYYYVLKRK